VNIDQVLVGLIGTVVQNLKNAAKFNEGDLRLDGGGRRERRW
jgi:hypothetical protein